MTSIQFSDNVPDRTYFTSVSACPVYDAEKDAFVCLNGEGRRRSWGKPGVTTTIVFRGARLYAFHVGWHHKHGGGQSWRYYRRPRRSSEFVRVFWRNLTDQERAKVLARFHRAPSWAKSPGQLRKPIANKKTHEFFAVLKRGAHGRFYVPDHEGIGIELGESLSYPSFPPIFDSIDRAKGFALLLSGELAIVKVSAVGVRPRALDGQYTASTIRALEIVE